MKPIKFILISISILSLFIFTACEKESEWVQINSVSAGAELNTHLDSIISAENSCLINFNNENVLHAIYSNNKIGEIDNCHEVSAIDFSSYTLIVGKVQVYSISDKIGFVNLNSKDNNYKIEVVIDKCTACYGAIGSLYFWRLYPRLKMGANFELDVN